MCGRVVVRSSGKQLAEALKLAAVAVELDRPDFNLPPTREIPVVINDGRRELSTARWGLVPSWAKDLKGAPLMNNARAEGITEKRTFSRLLTSKRCLVVCDAFYEWHRKGTGKNAVKTPYAIRRRDGAPLVFAGLWDQWDSGDGHLLTSCTVITTGANQLMGTIHDRMPVLVGPDALEQWLSAEKQSAEALTALLKPAAEDILELFEVGPDVGSVKNNHPRLLEPVAVKLPQ